MEIKRNEATLNRPKGDRVIDGSYVFIDIPTFIMQLQQEKAWEKNDRNGITVFKSDELAIVLSAVKAGSELPGNSVDGYLTIQLLHGKISVATPDGDVVMLPNQVIAFHPGILHSVQVIDDSILLLTNNSTAKGWMEAEEEEEPDPYA
jgi:quercetin dioxygenase-like cupin family protein